MKLLLLIFVTFLNSGAHALASECDLYLSSLNKETVSNESLNILKSKGFKTHVVTLFSEIPKDITSAYILISEFHKTTTYDPEKKERIFDCSTSMELDQILINGPLKVEMKDDDFGSVISKKEIDCNELPLKVLNDVDSCE